MSQCADLRWWLTVSVCRHEVVAHCLSVQTYGRGSLSQCLSVSLVSCVCTSLPRDLFSVEVTAGVEVTMRPGGTYGFCFLFVYSTVRVRSSLEL